MTDFSSKLNRINKRLRSLEASERNVNLLALTFVAGTIDAISYFELGHVFTANMTGNSVLLGLAIAQGNILSALRSTVALIGFGLGVAFGAFIVGRDMEKGEWTAVVTLSVGIETLVVGIFTFVSRVTGIALAGIAVYALIGILGFAMGMQSASMRHLDVVGVSTTFMTGTITSFIVGIIGWVGPAELPSAAPVESSRPSVRQRRVKLLGEVYATYLISAVAGGFVELRTQHWAVLLPLAALVFVVINGVIHHNRRME